jgi:hypothetical protein
MESVKSSDGRKTSDTKVDDSARNAGSKSSRIPVWLSKGLKNRRTWKTWARCMVCFFAMLVLLVCKASEYPQFHRNVFLTIASLNRFTDSGTGSLLQRNHFDHATAHDGLFRLLLCDLDIGGRDVLGVGMGSRRNGGRPEGSGCDPSREPVHARTVAYITEWSQS